jgi:hypothetical protein
VIPKHLHFIFGLAPRDAAIVSSPRHIRRDLIKGWGLSHYVCVRSAIEKIRPDAVSFYLENEPSGPWWELTKPLVDIIHVKAPSEIFGRSVKHYAHKADVIRLERLIRHGGIYLDADVLVHESFDPLLDHSMVMGMEGKGGLCNAVILAEKGAPFLTEWYENYRTFDDSRWSYHSVILPFELSEKYDSVLRLPEKAFFWPTWRAKGLYAMFGARNAPRIRGDFANHLCEQRARYYLGGLTPGHVRLIDSAFHTWARPYLDGLADDFGGGVDRHHYLPRHLFAKAWNIAHIAKEACMGA